MSCGSVLGRIVQILRVRLCGDWDEVVAMDRNNMLYVDMRRGIKPAMVLGE